MERNEQVHQLFDEVFDLPPEQQEAALRARCQDEGVVRRVLELLVGARQTPTLPTRPVELPPVVHATPVSIAGYHIVDMLGEGGMGIVYLAEDRDFDPPRRVALKVIQPALMLSNHVRERFRREAATAAKLDHPSIVPIYRYSEHEGPQFLAMKYIEGKTFDAYCKQLAKQVADKAMTEEDREKRIVRAVKSVAEALHHAHALKVVHRDVKPTNILIDANGDAFLTDFGIAKALDEPDITQTNVHPITPDYASPEQANVDAAQAEMEFARLELDGRSDVFSLGVVLYEALSEMHPFRRSNSALTLDAIRTFHPPSVRHCRRTISRRLAKIVRIAIEKERRYRYPTAAHLATDLGCWLRGEPIFGRDISLWRRVHRWAYQNRGLAIAVASIVLFAMVLLLAGVVIAQHRASTAPVHVWMHDHDPNVELFIARVDPATVAIGDFRRLGRLPVEERLVPGAYRLLAIAGGVPATFTESSIVVLRPGTVIEVELRLNVPATPADKDSPMIEFAGGAYDFGFPNRRGLLHQRTVYVEPFQIDAAEVSNAEYDQFVSETKREHPRYWREWAAENPKANTHFDPALADRPVVDVSWEDATAYARWRGKRLPTVFEWEFAMRNGGTRSQPWGEGDAVGFAEVPREDMLRANISDRAFHRRAYAEHTHDVRSDPTLRSPEKLWHGSSNVREIVESVSVGTTTQLMLKGTGWHQLPQVMTPKESFTLPFESVLSDGKVELTTSMTLGFRCAKSVKANP